MNRPRQLVWVSTAREDLKAFPRQVQRAVGFALFRAQQGSMPASAKPLKGFGGAGVLEIVDDFDGDAYRAVYTVQFAAAVYVLHAFQKKSTRGVATSRRDLALIRARLRLAQAIDAERRSTDK
jgi:phage-related protein